LWNTQAPREEGPQGLEYRWTHEIPETCIEACIRRKGRKEDQNERKSGYHERGLTENIAISLVSGKRKRVYFGGTVEAERGALENLHRKRKANADEKVKDLKKRKPYWYAAKPFGQNFNRFAKDLNSISK